MRSFLFGGITNNLAMNILGWPYLTFLLDLSQGVESLGCGTGIASGLLNNAKQLTKVSTFLSMEYESSNYSTPLPICTVVWLVVFFFFIQHILGVYWYLTENLIYIKILCSFDFPPVSIVFDGLHSWGSQPTLLNAHSGFQKHLASRSNKPINNKWKI